MNNQRTTRHLLEPLCGCASKTPTSHLLDSLAIADVVIQPEDVGTVVSPTLKLFQTIDGGPLSHPDLQTAGRIAVNHVLSDIFAKGLLPLSFSLSVEHPSNDPPECLAQFMRGVVQQLALKGTKLTKAHAAWSSRWRYHGAATGTLPAHGAFLPKQGAEAGDSIFLSKPIGVGRALRALALGLINEDDFLPITNAMLQSNRRVGSLAASLGCTSCTDVSGSGLLASLTEILLPHQGAEISLKAIPIHPLVMNQPAILDLPKSYLEDDNASIVRQRPIQGEIPLHLFSILNSAETSGGLLFTSSPRCRRDLVDNGRIEIGTITKTPQLQISQ